MTTATATEPTIIWRPHDGAQTEFLSRCEDIVLYGGAKGGGKSDAILGEATRQIAKPGYKALIIRRVFPQLQELIDRALKLYPALGGRWVSGEHRFIFPSGAYIEFGHCQAESDKERYQGREFAFIGFDQLEQFLESQFNFISAQSRTSDPDVKCYVRATANPGGVGHMWIKRRFIDNKKAGQTYTATYPLPDGRTVTRTSCYIKATVYDNPTLLKANPTYLANLLDLPDYERRAYLDGDWNAFSSQCVFDPRGMQLQEQKVKDPEWVGFLQEFHDTYRIVSDPKGNLKVWQTPEDGVEYQVSGDVAEGDLTGNYSSAHVVDKRNWAVVAVWHGHRTPFEFAKVLYNLGTWYNTAEIAPEVPGPGISTVEKLVEMGYPSIHKHDLDKYGWRTDTASRHNMLTTLMDAVKDGSLLIRDRDTMDEMYNFVRNEKTMKIEARQGCLDDRVMSLGIAVQCIRVNPFHEETNRHRNRTFSTSIFAGSEPRKRRSATGYR